MAGLPGTCYGHPVIDFEHSDPLSRLPQFGALTIFPVGPDKLPRLKWGELAPGEKILDPSTDPAYGIATGSRSGGLVVLDLDTKPGRDGLEWARNAPGPLPATFTVRTPSGGLHFYFSAPVDPVSNSSDKIAPGVDIRGEGGFVVGPGSRRADGGLYTVALDVPIAPLPAWLRDLAGAARPAKDRVLAPRDPSIPAPAVEDLERVTKSRRGPEWDAWRDVVRGARFLRVKGGTHGPERAVQGVDAFLTSMTWALATVEPDWSGQDVEALAGASLSILRADDEAAGNPVYDPGAFGDKFDGAASKVRSDRAASAALEKAMIAAVAEVEATGPKILQYRRSYYLRDARAGYTGPFVDAEIWSQARDREAFPVMKKAGKGEVRISPQDMMDTFGKGGALVDVALDFCATRAALERSPAGPVLVQPVAVRPGIVPEYHGEIATWLDLLGGDALLDWIAVVTDLSEACPALWFTGAPGTGKSLLARGLAALFGRSEPVPLEKALGRFNDALSECPIILGDEKIPSDNRGIPMLEEFKALVSDTSRRIEPKGLPLVTLRGAVRVILATNNVSAIRASKDLTQEDAEALSARLIHVRRDGKDAALIREHLERQPVQREWIDGGALARHLTHVIATRPAPPRGTRFRLPSDAGEIRDALLTQPGAGWEVCRIAHDWTIQAARAVQAGGPVPNGAIFWDNGHVHTTPSALAKKLEDSRSATPQSLGSSLKRIGTLVEVVREGQVERVYRLSWSHLIAWAESSGWGDARDLRAAIQVLQGRA